MAKFRSFGIRRLSPSNGARSQLTDHAEVGKISDKDQPTYRGRRPIRNTGSDLVNTYRKTPMWSCAVRYLPKASEYLPRTLAWSVGQQLGVGVKKLVWQHCTWIRARSVWTWESVGNKQWRGKTTKSLIAILLPLRLLIQSSLPPNMSSILSVLKTKLGEYMLALPNGATKYEDYEAWAQDMPELADWIAEAKIGLNPMATDDWLRAVHVALQHQQAAEEQALVEEREHIAVAKWEAAKAEAARAAAARELAKVDWEWCREVLVDTMFNGSLDSEEGERQLAELEATSVLPLPLFLPSLSPSTAVSSSHPNPSANLSQPDLSATNSALASATDALDQMSVGLVAAAAPTDLKGKQSAAAVVVEFVCQPTPPLGCVVLPLGPGMGRMSTARSPVERNGAGKLLEDPPELLPGDVLADYACHRCATAFLTKAFRCYQQPGLVLCTKCARESKGCSFQPGWMPTDKGKGKGKSKEKGKSVPKLEERGRPLEASAAAHTRKPVQRLPTTARAAPAPTRPSRTRSAAVPALPDSSRLSPVVAQGIASELRYHIAVDKGMRASLARSIAMWQVLVEDSSDAEDLGMSVLGDFVPDV
ncbi:hypothetical protein HETIRDRAFT_117601 [Heterobasidion irregulare TC 32-1]|uniref:Uncharacterized protein n=1 Tax=Heterobasidion irregulare (strain TC 32-1) TaxID=747525 RepID=W4JZK3_HETIT|nr:uncharacterized protein HETIRDRAFT_117601 [Heterobasidion irregulare TC 32-1]ETW78899.1 hypothetical protein HETIRDRAFT_117601 [Heterobasidion irregulare TC 32-1]